MWCSALLMVKLLMSRDFCLYTWQLRHEAMWRESRSCCPVLTPATVCASHVSFKSKKVLLSSKTNRLNLQTHGRKICVLFWTPACFSLVLFIYRVMAESLHVFTRQVRLLRNAINLYDSGTWWEYHMLMPSSIQKSYEARTAAVLQPVWYFLMFWQLNKHTPQAREVRGY